MTSGVHVRVLGSLELVIDGQTVDVPGTKRQAVLALLVLGAPDAVSIDRIVDAVWPDEPPASGRAALQSHISRLRRHLGPHASLLTRTAGGYRLAIARDDVDAAVLAETWAPWRGTPLDGLLAIPKLAAWSRKIVESWAEAGDALAAGALASGDTARALGVTAEVGEVEPLRESTVVLRVHALSVAGRVVEALREAHTFRKRLVEETGLDPSPALAAAEHDAAQGHAPPPSRVARPLTPLLGRDAEVAGVERLLASERLVTLLGPAGVGKSHLALEVAHRASNHVATTLVHLSAVTEGAAVAPALADALGIHGGATSDLVDRCARRLRGAPHLVVMDTCEHVLDEVRHLVAQLLPACPELVMLATSRERLAIAAEQTCRVDPLAAATAAELFLDRARRAAGASAIDHIDATAVTRVVRALDALPLAVELAAGRLAFMDVHDLEARLDRALDLLARPGASGTIAAAHHATLRAAITWSYDLLPVQEQHLFRTLAAFPDGVDLATAERVASRLNVEADPGTALAHLVDASMLVLRMAPSRRYAMLDTLRTFGLDALRACGEEQSALDGLVQWAVEFSTSFKDASHSEDEPAADAHLRAEIANIRAAWRVAMNRGDVTAAAAIAVGLRNAVVWRERADVRSWAIELASSPLIGGHSLEAGVCALAAEATWLGSGDLAGAELFATRAREALPPQIDETWALVHEASGDVQLLNGRTEEAITAFRLAMQYEPWAYDAQTLIALACAYAGDLATAQEELDGARRRPMYPTARAFARYVDGEIAGLERDWESAEAAYRDVIAAVRMTGASFVEGVAEVGLVSALVGTGRHAEALAGYRALIGRWERTGSWIQMWTTLRNLAELLETLGQRGASKLLKTAADYPPGPEATSERDEALTAARDAIAAALREQR